MSVLQDSFYHNLSEEELERVHEYNFDHPGEEDSSLSHHGVYCNSWDLLVFNVSLNFECYITCASLFVEFDAESFLLTRRLSLQKDL